MIVEISQPDGTKFKTIQKGDEWNNWHETEDGFTIIEDKTTGWWYYAIPDTTSGIRISSFPVGKIKPEQIKIIKSLKPIKKYLPQTPTKLKKLKTTDIIKTTSFPFTQNLLVIMADFNDVHGTYTSDSFRNTFFSKDLKSVVDYYNEISYGKFNIVPAYETFGENDGIVGWLRLDMNHPDCGFPGAKPECVDDLVTAIIKSADPYVDFSIFDKDNDDTITPKELSIIIVAAGHETAYSGGSPGIWAHRGYIPSITLDGKLLGDYALIGEKHSDHQATIGVMVHELGHLMLEFPDLYDTDKNSNSEGAGCFDLMAIGSWGKSAKTRYNGETPVHPSAWTKIYAGFITPDIFYNQTKVPLPDVSENPNAIKVLTQNSFEYFLLENRYTTGYDAGLERWFKTSQETGGVAIWHIDEMLLEDEYCVYYNNCNNNENHKLVDLEEADGVQNLDIKDQYGNLQDLFYTLNNSKFNDSTNPASRLYDSSPSNISISNISKQGKLMSLDINVPHQKLTNLILNSGFESGQIYWNEYTSSNSNIITGDADYPFSHKGNWVSWMGRYNYETDYIYQDVIIPSDAANAYLKFWYFISTFFKTTDIVHDKLKVEILNPSDNSLLKNIVTLSEIDKTESWIETKKYNLLDFAGQVIRLRFYVTNDKTEETRFYIDDISLMLDKKESYFFPDIQVSNTSVDFDSLYAEDSTAQTISITNIGNKDLFIDKISLTGNDSESFFIQNDFASNQLIPPDEITSFDIAFLPAMGGIKKANINILSNDPDASLLNIMVTGKAIPLKPKISFNKTYVNYGTVEVGTKVDSTIMIVNNGQSDLLIKSLNIKGTDPDEFNYGTISNEVIQPLDSLNIIISFLPVSAKTKNATLIINSNDPERQTSTIILTGNGVITDNKNNYTGNKKTKKSGCYIKKITYGQYINSHIKSLNDFKDKYLLCNSHGKSFVKFYYKYSPFISNFIKLKNLSEYNK
ncbi:MAG: M6 family metalloprotease domain-containing protein [Candidatus Firestonebacteria bacterium]|nr:M6 family metalloprotease domain-containing protein [Candidatus Firestonebacteria bacterium]